MMIKLSIIIPVYNCEKYIYECVASTLKQKLKDIEVIIIDDGSTDDTLNILNDIKSKYNMVRVIEQKNFGPSRARNQGIKIAQGEYITFLDADDILKVNTIHDIYIKMKDKKADIFIGNIECFNEYRTWHLDYMKQVFLNHKNIVSYEQDMNLLYTPSVCNKWFKRSLIIDNNIYFDEDIKVGEDLLFTQRALLKAQIIIKENVDIYGYRVSSESSLIKSCDITFFEQLFNLQSKICKLNCSDKIKNKVLFRQIKFLIDSIFIKKDNIKEQDYDKLVEISSKIVHMSEIDYIENVFQEKEKLIFYKLLVDKNIEGIKILLNIIKNKYAKKDIVKKDGNYYSYLLKYYPQYQNMLQIESLIESKVEKVSYNDSIIKIYGYAFVRGIDLQKNNTYKKFIVIDDGERSERIQLKNQLRTDLTYLYRSDNLNYDWGGYENVEIDTRKLISKDGMYKVFIEVELENKSYRNTLDINIAELKNSLKVKYWKYNKFYKKEVYCIFNQGKQLNIRIRTISNIQYIKSRLRKLRRDFRYDYRLIKDKKYKSFICLYTHKIFGKLIRKKEIWLLGERKDMAQDNTYHIYKYIKENKKHINAKYILEKDSNDKKYIQEYGKFIKFGSILHTIYLLNCKFSVNSYVERPNMYTKEYLDIVRYYPEYKKRKKIFLQHGVIGVSRVNHVLHKNKVDYDLFIVSSELEKKHIVKEYGYNEEEVIVTGLARWDNLIQCCDNQKILLMPTWRSWIKNEKELFESDYFNKYIELLQSEKLNQYLTNTNKTITFYPHYQTRKILNDLKYKFSDRVKLVNQECTVQSLINEHSLLITDYSTVAFDFAYSKKQVIFYQFDYEEFYSNHYNEGYINHKDDLFGARAETLDEVIYCLEEYNKINRDNNLNKYLVKKQHCKEIIKCIEEIN